MYFVCLCLCELRVGTQLTICAAKFSLDIFCYLHAVLAKLLAVLSLLCSCAAVEDPGGSEDGQN